MKGTIPKVPPAMTLPVLARNCRTFGEQYLNLSLAIQRDYNTVRRLVPFHLLSLCSRQGKQVQIKQILPDMAAYLGGPTQTPPKALRGPGSSPPNPRPLLLWGH